MLSTVVIGILVIIAAVLVLKLIGKVVSMIFTFVGIAAVVWLVIIGLQYLDEKNIRDKMSSSNSLFVLEDEGSMITGFATKEGLPEPDLVEVQEEVNDPSSELYDSYYKVFIVKKEALPEKISLLIDEVEPEEQTGLFRNYVDNNILEGDYADNLITAEKEGDIEVHKESIAFRHGFKEMLKS